LSSVLIRIPPDIGVAQCYPVFGIIAMVFAILRVHASISGWFTYLHCWCCVLIGIPPVVVVVITGIDARLLLRLV